DARVAVHVASEPLVREGGPAPAPRRDAGGERRSRLSRPGERRLPRRGAARAGGGDREGGEGNGEEGAMRAAHAPLGVGASGAPAIPRIDERFVKKEPQVGPGTGRCAPERRLLWSRSAQSSASSTRSSHAARASSCRRSRTS